MNKEYTLADFTAYSHLAKKHLFSKVEYENHKYPEYERLCMRAQKYILVPPEECIKNLTFILPEHVEIWDAIRDGDLTRLKELHNDGCDIPFYISSQMEVACRYKQLHIVQYLFEKGGPYSDIDILKHFPVLKDAVDEKAASKIDQLQHRVKYLEDSLQSIRSICNLTK